MLCRWIVVKENVRLFMKASSKLRATNLRKTKKISVSGKFLHLSSTKKFLYSGDDENVYDEDTKFKQAFA